MTLKEGHIMIKRRRVIRHRRRPWWQVRTARHWAGLPMNVMLAVGLLTVIMWQDIYEVIHARITG